MGCGRILSLSHADLQGIASAALWDAETATVPGMVSASDFIQVYHSENKNYIESCIAPACATSQASAACCVWTATLHLDQAVLS